MNQSLHRLAHEMRPKVATVSFLVSLRRLEEARMEEARLEKSQMERLQVAKA
jgi:hypothetical protein